MASLRKAEQLALGFKGFQMFLYLKSLLDERWQLLIF